MELWIGLVIFVFLYLFLQLAGEDKAATPVDDRLQELIKKYGEEWGPLIHKGKLEIGMKADMVQEILGKPSHINKDINKDGQTMKSIYEIKNDKGQLLETQTLTFINGILTNINIQC